MKKSLTVLYRAFATFFPGGVSGWSLDGGDFGQPAAMSHGMARIRLGRLERVLVAFRASAGVIICLSSGRENRHHSRT